MQENPKVLIPSAYKLLEGRDFFSSLYSSFDLARKSIDMEMFTLESDSVGKAVLDKLGEAAMRGVKVRLLLDHSSSNIFRLLPTRRKIQSLLNLNDSRAKNGSPIEIDIKYMKDLEKDKKGLRRPSNIFYRDHRKLVAIDGQIGYIGGLNIARRYTKYRDFMIKIADPNIVDNLERDFQSTWNLSHPDSTKYVNEDGSILISDEKNQTLHLEELEERIRNASNRIWIQSPYPDFKYWAPILTKKKLEDPDLDIRILVPNLHTAHSPLEKIPFVSTRKYRKLAKAGISIFLTGDRDGKFRHAKGIIVDDTAIFGSSNYNKGILAGKNAEMLLFTENIEALATLEDWQKEEMSLSKEVK